MPVFGCRLCLPELERQDRNPCAGTFQDNQRTVESSDDLTVALAGYLRGTNCQEFIDHGSPQHQSTIRPLNAAVREKVRLYADGRRAAHRPHVRRTDGPAMGSRRVVVVLLISPHTWIGRNQYVNAHFWFALFFGGVICSLPMLLALGTARRVQHPAGDRRQPGAVLRPVGPRHRRSD